MTFLEINSLIKDITPDRLKGYLISTNWVNAGDIEGKANVWHRPEEKNFDLEVIQPVSTGIKDYSQRMYEAIHALSEYEESPPHKILEKLKNFDSDIVKIRVIGHDVDGGAIPIDDGVLLFEKAKELLVSSTLSAFHKKKFFSGSWPAYVKEFIDTLRFGQTERGSYVVNVIAPISQTPKGISDGTCSITRSISNNLARTLRAANAAIEDYEKTGNLLSFEGAVSSGVSANLCDAIIGMSGSSQSRDVEITIELAASEDDVQDIVRTHRFTSSHMPVLSAASEYYKGNFVIKNYEARGLVVRMDHEPAEDYGVIRVISIVNGAERNISVQLRLDDYWDAVKAHKPRLPVFCRGDLHVSPRSAVLVDPRDFNVIGNTDLFDDKP